MESPVVAGFDANKAWHDGGNGRFAKLGWSTAKRAALALVRGATAAAYAKADKDGVDLTLRDHKHKDRFPDLIRAEYHSPTHASVKDLDGRTRLIRWDEFNEPDIPNKPAPPVTQDRAVAPQLDSTKPGAVLHANENDIPVVQNMVERPWPGGVPPSVENPGNRTKIEDIVGRGGGFRYKVPDGYSDDPKAFRWETTDLSRDTVNKRVKWLTAELRKEWPELADRQVDVKYALTWDEYRDMLPPSRQGDMPDATAATNGDGSVTVFIGPGEARGLFDDGPYSAMMAHRVLAHELAHASSRLGGDTGMQSGMNKVLEEGMAEISSMLFFAGRVDMSGLPESVNRYRRESQAGHTYDALDVMARRSVYRERTAMLIMNAAETVGWDRDKIIEKLFEDWRHPDGYNRKGVFQRYELSGDTTTTEQALAKRLADIDRRYDELVARLPEHADEYRADQARERQDVIDDPPVPLGVEYTGRWNAAVAAAKAAGVDTHRLAEQYDPADADLFPEGFDHYRKTVEQWQEVDTVSASLVRWLVEPKDMRDDTAAAPGTPVTQQLAVAPQDHNAARAATDSLSARPTIAAQKSAIKVLNDTDPALVTAARLWHAESQPMADAARGMANPDIDRTRPTPEVITAVETLVNTAADAPPVDVPLYRGVILPEIPEPGGTLSDPLGAWSTNRDVAVMVADMRSGVRDGEMVVLKVEGAKATPIAHLARVDDKGDRYKAPHVAAAGEYIASGDYEVIKVQPLITPVVHPKSIREGIYKPNPNTTVRAKLVTVRQRDVNRLTATEDGTVWWPNAKFVPQPVGDLVTQNMVVRPVVLEDSGGIGTVDTTAELVLPSVDDVTPAVGTPDTPTAAVAVPAVKVEGRYSFVTDTSVPWEDRVARMVDERDILNSELGPPDYWFQHPDATMMNRVWDADAGMETMPPAAVGAFRNLDRIEAYGTALSALVAERAEAHGGTGVTRKYTPEAAETMIEALDGFLSPDTEWKNGSNATFNGEERWAETVAAIRAGTAQFLLKPNLIALVYKDSAGKPVTVKIERSNYVGDHGVPYRTKVGHVEQVGDTTSASILNRNRSWRRGNGDFAAVRKQVKSALDASRKETAADQLTPPTLQAWFDIMDLMGVDMGIDDNVHIGLGMPEIDEYTDEPDFGLLDQIDTTPWGDFKQKGAAGQTIAAGLAPYPKDWTSRLPPQIVNTSTKISERLGNASNRRFDNGDGNLVNVASVVAHPEHASSVAHEFGHSMQNSIPGLHLGEMWHLMSRLRAHPDQDTTDDGYGRGVALFPDDFGSSYSGRVYFASEIGDATDTERIPTVRSFELFTTGVQTLYSTDRRGGLDSDPRLTAFTLGMMGLIRNPEEVRRPISNIRRVPEPVLPDRPEVGYSGVPDKQALRIGQQFTTADEWADRVKQADDHLVAVASEATTRPVIRVDSANIESVIESGRIGSMLETARPKRLRDESYFEHVSMGVPKATAPSARPVYGTVLNSDALSGNTKSTGEILFLPKPGRMHGRVTVSNGSATYGSVAPLWADMVGHVSPNRAAAAWHNGSGAETEIQIHGPNGVDLNDIGRVAVPDPPKPGSMNADSVRTLLAANGYPDIDVVTYPVEWKTDTSFGTPLPPRIDTADYAGIPPVEFDTILVNGKEHRIGDGHYNVVNGRQVWIPDENLAAANIKSPVTFVGMTAAEPGTKEAYGFRIPPAWTDVHVSDTPEGVGGMLIRGTDTKGRYQYVYSAEHTANQAAAKFERIKAFNTHLDTLDSKLENAVDNDDTAAALLLIRKLGMRPGSTADTKAEKQAYGATTLQARHAKVYPSGRTTFTFTGKKGVKITLTSMDPTIHRVITDRLNRATSPRDSLFQTNAVMVNRWLDDTVPSEFKVKDLRTVKANSIALKLVKSKRPPKTVAEYKRLRNQIADAVAKALGNTRTVALASYINPVVFAPWETRVAA